MRRALFFGSVVLALCWAAPAWTIGPVTGTARVLRGDTLAIGGARIRLKGIASPGERETCGDRPCVVAAQTRLGEILAGQEVECTREKRLQHGLYLGICVLADGRDVGAELLRSGWGRLGEDEVGGYRRALEEAAAAKRGLFAQ